MRTSAGAGGPTNLPENVTVLPGVTLMAPADVDRLITAAKLLEGLALHATAVRGAIPLFAPSSAAERLADIIGRIETLATMVEAPALTAQGLVDDVA